MLENRALGLFLESWDYYSNILNFGVDIIIYSRSTLKQINNKIIRIILSQFILNFQIIRMSRCTLTGKVILNRYLVGSCIGYGSFGDVYLVYDIQAEQIYAMKSEAEKTKNPQLANQAKIIKELSKEKGFVPFHFYGYESKFNVVIMGLLGPSLEDLFNACNRQFSLKTILMLAEQIINRIEVFHSKNYVYRDIKPQNFLMGLHQHSHIVHLVDFGLSKKYRDSKNHQHIPYRQNRSLVGTVRYCSINMHLGLQYSRRDDLQSIGYMLQYFYKGSLPWQGIHANSNLQKYSKILQQKQGILIQQQFMDMPVQFSTYMHYCKSLKFNDRPDYTFLRKIFTDLMEKLGYEKDYIFDWCKLQHSAKLQNGTMSLMIRNKYSDLENPYVTMMSGDMENLHTDDILIKIDEECDEVKESVGEAGQKQKPEEKQKYNSHKIHQKKLNLFEDENEGNIDPQILQDSELKLISHRSKWFQSEL